MDKRKILLVDNDSKNIRILQESFAEKNYIVDHTSSDSEAYQRIEKQPYNAILSEIAPPEIDGHRLLEKLQRNQKTSTIPLIFLTKKSDIWNRVRSFRLGAKDFIVKPVHVMEIISRVSMVLSRLEKRNEEEALARKKFVGRLEDLSVADLIETFGVERKTGVLTLNNENGFNGQIFIKNGAVVNANSNGLVAEDAIYKMINWNKGRFSMLFKNVNVPDDISISNLGLLIQGVKRLQNRDKILKELPSLESVLVTTSNFKKIISQKKLAPDLDHFLTLFDGERTLARIIDESSYDDLTTLERISKLFRLGFIRALRGAAPETEQAEHEKIEIPEQEASFSEEDEFTENEIEDDSAFFKETELEFEDHIYLENEDDSQLIDNDPFLTEPETFSELGKNKQEDISYEQKENEDIIPDIPKWAISNHSIRNQNKAKYSQKIEEIDSETNNGAEEDNTSNYPPVPLLKPGSSTDLREMIKEIEEFSEEEPDPELEDSLFEEYESDSKNSESFTSHKDEPIPTEDITEKGYVSRKFSREDKSPLIKPQIPVQKQKILTATSESELEQKTLSSDSKEQSISKLAKAHVLIIGPDYLGRKKIIEVFDENNCHTFNPSNDSVSDIYYTTVDFKGGHHLNLMGISSDKEIPPLLDFLAPNTLGYILLVDLKNPGSWDYLGYLIRTIDDRLHVPSLLAAFTQREEANSSVGDLQNHLSLSDSKRLYICESMDMITIKRMIFILFGVGGKATECLHVVQRNLKNQPSFA